MKTKACTPAARDELFFRWPQGGRAFAMGAVGFLFLGSAWLVWATDFDALAEYEGSFQSVGTTEPTWSAKEGKGGSGGLVAGSSGDVACVRTDPPLALKPGQSVVVSMNFLHKGQTARAAERNAGVFLTSEPEAAPLAVAKGVILSAFLHNVGGPEATKLGFSSGGETSNYDAGTLDSASGWWDSDALLGHWCQVRVRFLKLPVEGLWEMDIKVLDMGEFGDGPPVEIYALNVPEITAKALYSAEKIFPGFQNLRNDRGFRSMDDFEVTVE